MAGIPLGLSLLALSVGAAVATAGATRFYGPRGRVSRAGARPS